MREALKAAGKTAEIVVYPDTPHAFFADYRPSYRKDAGRGRLEADARLVQEERRRLSDRPDGGAVARPRRPSLARPPRSCTAGHGFCIHDCAAIARAPFRHEDDRS